MSAKLLKNLHRDLKCAEDRGDTGAERTTCVGLGDAYLASKQQPAKALLYYNRAVALGFAGVMQEVLYMSHCGDFFVS